MKNIKKAFILVFLLAIAVSPIIPFAKATDGQWQTTVSNEVWEYDLYKVQQLSFDKTVLGPYEFNNGVFVTEKDDITFLKNGSALKINDIDKRITSSFWHSAQDERFIYFVPSTDEKSWGTIYEYDSESGLIKKLDTITRKSDDLNFFTAAVDGTRVYASILHIDKKTKNIENKLVVRDYVTGYENDDITWTLQAPIQEIVDVRNDVLLVKFQFDGGFKQLITIDEKARQVVAVPETWTQPDGDIVGAHFLSDGTIQYFKNYRLFTYKPGVDLAPRESGGAYLNWFVDAEAALQFVGDRMAYVDPENTLYVTDSDGAHNFGKALGGRFYLDKDAIYYESLDGFISYTFSTKSWKATKFEVTDVYQDILIGQDEYGDIWYENTTTGKIINIGFGSDSVLSDREHAVWKGKDGKIYQAIFSTALDLGDPDVQAYKTYNSSTVYLMTDNEMWRVTSEKTYFTWFDSWQSVVSVSPQTLKVYMDSRVDMGDALYAQGTRVKAVGNPKIYIVGSDGSLHWIVSETVADSIYGSQWNKDIIEVSTFELWNYSSGTNVNYKNDVQFI